MNLYLIVNVGRQVEGELVLIQAEKGFITRENAESFLKSKPQQEIADVQTEVGAIQCHCVRGIFEVPVPDLNFSEINIAPELSQSP